MYILNSFIVGIVLSAFPLLHVIGGAFARAMIHGTASLTPVYERRLEHLHLGAPLDVSC